MLERRREKQHAELDFRRFVGRVNPRYVWYPHCEKIADVAERIATGELKRVMLFVPPRHSKSETISRLFTAYYLIKNPAHWVGLTSYSSELAYVLSRASQDNYLRAGGTLNERAGAVKHWETTAGGGLWAAGVGGPITGKGFHVGIIDDPIKNAEEATSEVIRARHKEWYSSTFYTRAEPDAIIVVIQCMTGDTPVLMADGNEIPLRDIKVGDRIATYDQGRLASSTVLNHASNGKDAIFKITTVSGTVVRANSRHPFLVDVHGELKWLRLKDLTTAHKIVTLKGKKGSGKAKPAPLMDAGSLPSAEGIALRTITRRNGQMAIARHPLTQRLTETHTLNIGTESPLQSMTQCWHLKTVNAPFASSLPATMYAHIGAASSALTTATIATGLEDSCVTTAIWPLDTPKQKKPRSPWLNTSDFTTDQIESIEPAGIEEVFDIQVDRTENFIANGLVSHNTRWHEDDLSGWLLSEETGESPERWHIVNLPAIADESITFPASCTMEPDWRNTGEALCPERYDLTRLEQIKSRISSYFFDALYQQRPSAKEGEFFKVSALQIVREAPATLRTCRAWDLAASSGKGDYTAGVKIGVDANGIWYVLDTRRGQWSPDERDGHLRLSAQTDGNTCKVRLAQDPGQAGVDQAQRLTRLLSGYSVRSERVTGDKPTRASGFAAQVNAGNVRLVRGNWNAAFIEEMRQFPQGKNDDQIDAAADAFNELSLGGQFKVSEFLR